MQTVAKTYRLNQRRWPILAKLLTIVGLMTSLAQLVIANEVVRPRNADQLPLGTAIDLGYRVTTAKVVTFNRPALERDFPQLKGLSDDNIESWILENFAYINANQLSLTGIRNTHIALDKLKTKRFHIPPGVGRGAVVESDYGLVDIKACGNSSWNLAQLKWLERLAREWGDGLLEARRLDHSSGLETYDLATAEYLRQLEIQSDYNRRNNEAGSNYQTVESYFLIDYGFNVIYPDREIPVFMYGRQAHFGRTADNIPLSDEIYTDKGRFQESYTGSRIDFGGSRTQQESTLAYHEQMKRLAPESAAAFIKNKSKNFVTSTRAHPTAFVDSAEAREILSSRPHTLTRPPTPEAIGRSHFDMNESWMIDDPRIARIKWTLAELTLEKRIAYLEAIGDDALTNLFYLSIYDFQMPLPENVYLYAIRKETTESAKAAARAAVRVFDRFNNLEKPTVEFALRELERNRNSWAPPVINELIDTNFNFKNADAFIMSVLKIENTHATKAIIYQLSKEREYSERTHRVLDWIENHSKDHDVLKEMQFRFADKRKPRACEEIMGSGRPT